MISKREMRESTTNTKDGTHARVPSFFVFAYAPLGFGIVLNSNYNLMRVEPS